MLSPVTSSPSQTIPGRRGRIYLAGPFTTHLSEGVIDPQSAWRQTLQATAEALAADGWAVFLPHRDVSRWGERNVSPGIVARECLEAVMASDVVVAVMGESFGTHVEVGAALARGIPVVAVRCSVAAESFFALAVAQSPWVGVLTVPTLSDMPKMVVTDAFHQALGQAKASRLGEVMSSRHHALRP